MVAHINSSMQTADSPAACPNSQQAQQTDQPRGAQASRHATRAGQHRRSKHARKRTESGKLSQKLIISIGSWRRVTLRVKYGQNLFIMPAIFSEYMLIIKRQVGTVSKSGGRANCSHQCIGLAAHGPQATHRVHRVVWPLGCKPK